MSNIPISSLPLAISLDGSEEVPIVQAGTTKRTTTSAIAGQASGFVPTTTRVNAGVGLNGGGPLSSDVTLNLDILDLTPITAMAAADSFAINQVSGGDQPVRATFPNAMKALTGLPTLSIPNLSSDFMIINRAADGLTYKINPSALSLAAGNVPAGGTTSQFLAKFSDTNYDTYWTNASITLDPYSVAANPTGSTALGTSLTGSAYQVLRMGTDGLSLAFGSVDVSQSAVVGSSILRTANGGTGIASPTAYNLLIGAGSSAMSQLAPSATSGVPLISQGSSANPAYGTAVVAGGGTGLTSTTAYALLAGGTTSTGNLQQVSGLGTSGFILTSNGAGQLPTWQANAASGTVNSGTAGQLTYYATTGTAVSGNANLNVTAGALTLGQSGSVIGQLALAGNTSGTATITPQAAAGSPTLTLPNASGTFAVSASAPLVLNSTTGNLTVTSAALTKTDDTNVTLTLGGSPSTALLAATSLTMGWTGQLALSRGGTAANITPSNGGLIYSTSTVLAILNGTATANQIPLSGSNAAPAWSTATYPATAAAGTVLAAGTSNTISATVSPTLGVQQTTRGSLILANTAAGAFSATLQSSNSATAATTLTLPPDAGTSGYVLSTDGAGVLNWISVGGTGTVTSVSFTGGLISVANATTTPALTVAGTSGGVPYFSSSSTWATSAALAANAVLIGGGAGAAPSSTTTGTGVVAAIGQNVTGSGGIVLANTPTLVTPVLGAATGTSVTLTGAAPQVVLGANTTTLGAVKMFGSTSGDATIQPAAIAGTATVLTLPSATGTILSTAQTATITKGFTVTPNNIGTVSSGTTTLAPANGNYQYLSNNGAFTLAAPSSDCAIDLLVTNAGSAGAITFSGFTVGSSTGSALTTTNTNKFLISVRRINSVSTYSIYALQ